MTTEIITGDHFGLAKDGTVTFYEVSGYVTSSGEWVMSQPEIMDGLFNQVDPVDVAAKIEAGIDQDLAAGLGDQVAMVLMSPQMAVMAFMEGIISTNDLRAASGNDEYVLIPNINFLGRDLAVRVVRDAYYNVATADKGGNIL